MCKPFTGVIGKLLHILHYFTILFLIISMQYDFLRRIYVGVTKKITVRILFLLIQEKAQLAVLLKLLRLPMGIIGVMVNSAFLKGWPFFIQGMV